MGIAGDMSLPPSMLILSDVISSSSALHHTIQKISIGFSVKRSSVNIHHDPRPVNTLSTAAKKKTFMPSDAASSFCVWSKIIKMDGLL